MLPALRSIIRWDGVRFFAGTRHVAVRYSHQDGRCRVSGLACHNAARSANRSSAPSAASFPLLACQPVAQGVDQVVVRELVVANG